MTGATRSRAELRDYGPVQMGDRLGLVQFQIERALAAGLIPASDRPGGRWSAAVVDQAAGQLEEIRASVGSFPDCGAVRAAEELGRRFGTDVHPDTLLELADLGVISAVGHYKGHKLYDGQALEAFNDRDLLITAVIKGRLRTADECAVYLRCRRSDLGHLISAGWLKPITHVRSPWQRRRASPAVPLYRTGDLDVLLVHPAIDWDEVRATPRGRPSPLANLTRRHLS